MLSIEQIKKSIFDKSKELRKQCKEVELVGLLDSPHIDLRNDTEHDYTLFETAIKIDEYYLILFANKGKLVDWKWIGYNEKEPNIFDEYAPLFVV